MLKKSFFTFLAYLMAAAHCTRCNKNPADNCFLGLWLLYVLPCSLLLPVSKHKQLSFGGAKGKTSPKPGNLSIWSGVVGGAGGDACSTKVFKRAQFDHGGTYHNEEIPPLNTESEVLYRLEGPS